jgi:cell division protein FtsB
MADSRTKTERRSAVAIAILGVVAAALTALTSYLAVTKADVAQQRDDVQGEASTLSSQQSTLERQVTRLTRENEDLRAQLDASTKDSVGSEPAASDVDVRILTVPLPEDSSMGIFIDEGQVSTDCCPDLFYGRQEATGRPQLTADVPYSTAVQSATLEEDCSRAVETSPTIKPIRPLHTGLRICVRTDGGISLLQVLSAPRRDGTLGISRKFWPSAEP